MRELFPNVIIKPIVNPFKDYAVTEVNEEDIRLLHEWQKVNSGSTPEYRCANIVKEAYYGLVRERSRGMECNYVYYYIADVIWHRMENELNALLDPMNDWDYDFHDSVAAYQTSLFDMEFNYDTSSVVKLWERGVVVSFDGKTWRLHGKNGMVIYEEVA